MRFNLWRNSEITRGTDNRLSDYRRRLVVAATALSCCCNPSHTICVWLLLANLSPRRNMVADVVSNRAKLASTHTHTDRDRERQNRNWKRLESMKAMARWQQHEPQNHVMILNAILEHTHTHKRKHANGAVWASRLNPRRNKIEL